MPGTMIENVSSNALEPIRVFVSYARQDAKWLDPAYSFNIVPFLADSLRRYSVTFWFDRELVPGDEYKRHIDAEIDKSQIALLIITQHFLNSEFIETRELPRIAGHAERDRMIVIPMLVEPCDWNEYMFLSDRQMVPSEPLVDYTDSDKKWTNVRSQILRGLREQVDRIRGGGDLQHVRHIKTLKPEVGKNYLGTVVRLAEFGAFLEILPGVDGLMHISEIAEHRVKDLKDELHEGDKLIAKVLSIDGNRIKLSRKAVILEEREKGSKVEPGTGEGTLAGI